MGTVCPFLWSKALSLILSTAVVKNDHIYTSAPPYDFTVFTVIIISYNKVSFLMGGTYFMNLYEMQWIFPKLC